MLYFSTLLRRIFKRFILKNVLKNSIVLYEYIIDINDIIPTNAAMWISIYC